MTGNERLLTDAEIGQAWMRYIKSSGWEAMGASVEVCKAQDGQTLKAVGEYLSKGWLSAIEGYRLVSIVDIETLLRSKMPGDVKGD